MGMENLEGAFLGWGVGMDGGIEGVFFLAAGATGGTGGVAAAGCRGGA